MRVLIVAEGKHELDGALEALIRRLNPKELACDQRKVSDPALRAYQGKGPGYLKETIRDAKSVCIALRAAAGLGANLSEMYADIAREAELHVIEERCPTGFGPFAERVRRL